MQIELEDLEFQRRATASVVALRGVIVRNSARIHSARIALSDVFPYVATGDGFYRDGSFLFHNFSPYNGGYGAELIDSDPLGHPSACSHRRTPCAREAG